VVEGKQMIPHQVLDPVYERQDTRGSFIEITRDYHWETVITGTMESGSVLGNHYHKETMIFFYLCSGLVDIDIINVETLQMDHITLNKNQGIMLSTFESHAIRFREKSNFIMLKSIRYNPDNPDTFPYNVPTK